MKINHFN